MRSRRSIPLLFLVLFLVPVASAKNNSEITQFGHDIRIAPDQKTADLTCIGCSIFVRGEVAGEVTTICGSVSIEGDGQVAGDVTTIGGNVRVDNGTKIAGDLTAIGGKVSRQPQATVAGDVTTFEGKTWLVLIFGLPLLLFAGIIALLVWLVQRSRRPVQPLARAA
jgi:predicted acyltransferase (DUF342 family)